MKEVSVVLLGTKRTEERFNRKVGISGKTFAYKKKIAVQFLWLVSGFEPTTSCKVKSGWQGKCPDSGNN